MCGIVGVYSNEPVVRDLFYALNTLQHRGQESCGIAVSDDKDISCHKGMGLVQEVFREENIQNMNGNIGIGHVRYSTAGGSYEYNTQPLLGFSKGKRIAIAHNGNLINNQLLKTRLEEDGMMFQTTIDSEVILYLISRYYNGNMLDAVKKTMDLIKGAYSLVVMLKDKMVAVRDPYGFRPLVMGRRGDDYIFASETGVIDVLGGEYIRDLEPGEIVIVKDNKMESHMYEHKAPMSTCIFEHIYFARPDSIIDEQSVYSSRIIAGRDLAIDSPVEADLVTGVPESGNVAAMGYALQSGIPYGTAFIKNGYVGRTFIKPKQSQRESSVRVKLNVLKEAVAGKRVIMIDDSIVR